MDPTDLNRRALDQAGEFVARVTTDQLDRPTPCGGWTLGDLLRHMVGHNHGWAAAAHGLPADSAVWEGGSLGDDPAAAYRGSAGKVIDAFTTDGFLDRTLDVYEYGMIPARGVLRMHFVDFLVHGWDVAASLQVPAQLDPGLCDEALRMALRWPYHRPDKAFGVKVDVPADAPVQDRLIAYLGRSPLWPR